MACCMRDQAAAGKTGGLPGLPQQALVLSQRHGHELAAWNCLAVEGGDHRAHHLAPGLAGRLVAHDER
eukprot:7580991-Lingulodinium_polyedra.AAC.1